MKKQIPLQQPQEEESPPVLMNSIVNPQGIVPEPISESVKKVEQNPQETKKRSGWHGRRGSAARNAVSTDERSPGQDPRQVQEQVHKQVQAKPANIQEKPSPPKQESQDSLLNTERTLQLPTEKKPTQDGNDRQMQSDLRYTSVMRKKEKVGNREAEKKVNSISGRADNVLMKMKTVFPFDLFPDTVTIDSNKVSIVNKMFFASETVTAILLEEITDVVVESNFFVAQMVITYSHHPLKPLEYKIPNLQKKEALRAAEIIQGLLVLRISEGIDLSKLQPEDITKELSNIGKAHEHMPAL